jgi:hypothetical protein
MPPTIETGPIDDSARAGRDVSRAWDIASEPTVELRISEMRIS